MIDLSPEHEQIVKAILRQYVPNAAVHVFGSRSDWTAKPHSDLDLVIIGKEEVARPRGRFSCLIVACVVANAKLTGKRGGDFAQARTRTQQERHLPCDGTRD